MTGRPPLLFYCQHSVGLGHLVRSFALAGALAERFRVVLLCGGTVPEALPPPPEVELVELPPLGVDASGTFASGDPRLSLDEARARRRREILRTYRALRPAAVVIELFPFGRAKFAGELLPLLREARAEDRVVACSLRDILVGGRADQAAYDERACRLANAWFDAILVHSDPAFVRLGDSFRRRARLRLPLHYTGFVRPNGGPARLRREPRVVVSAGGGRVGEELLACAAASQPELSRRTGLGMRLIAGPFLPAAAWARLSAAVRGRPGIELVRSVPDLGTELSAAEASISQCGYNTAIEILGARVPALVVPYATPEEDEQSVRARRLEALGAVRVLDPARLDPRTLAAEAARLTGFAPRMPALDMNGAGGTARVLAALVAERAGGGEAPRAEEARAR